MRPLEIALLALVVVPLAARIAFLRRPGAAALANIALALAAAAALAQGLLEGFRPQLLPIHLAVLVGLLLAGLHPATGLRAQLLRGGLCGGLLLALAGGMLAWVLPVPRLPAPPGPYAVGTHLFHVTDPDREDPYTPGAAREFMLQAWYPAVPPPGAAPAPWLPEAPAYVEALSERLGGLPPAALGHLRLIQSHAFPDAPMIGGEAPLPVVVYSHGWTGFRQVAADQCEALAGAGYIVLAPDHTHGALATRMPDGRVLPNRPEAMPPREPEDARQAGIEKLVDMYAADLRRTLDLLAALHEGHPPSPLAGRIDLARVGLWGHSTGGGAVVEARVEDPRIRAAAALDPWVEPVSPENRMRASEVPFLSLRCEDWVRSRGANNAILAGVLAEMRGPVYDLVLADSRHADFTMMPLISPLVGLLGQTGPIPGEQGMAVTRDVLLAFFDYHLRGKPGNPWQLLERHAALRAAGS